jgi:CheY-like chemotaxis protein
VSEVRDGVEAVEAALRLMPAAVVLDRVLPRLGAGEVAERLREHTVTESVPLLSLANAADLGEWADLFCAHLPKPVDVVRLAEVLVALRHERLRLRGGSPAVAPAD